MTNSPEGHLRTSDSVEPEADWYAQRMSRIEEC